MKAKAVLISDIHYNINTMTIATQAMTQAIAKATDLGVPLIIAGDLHDTKALLRAECMNEMKRVINTANTPVYVLRGNHDSVNERSTEHALGFLGGANCTIIDHPASHCGMLFIPYQHEPDSFMDTIKDAEGITVCHQGVIGSNMGEYVQDKSAVDVSAYSGGRIISGHYHARQDIKLSGKGLWSYIGNPYTLTFGEAKDPDKGFQVLYDDGSLQFVPTSLRKHVIIEVTQTSRVSTSPSINKSDLVWVKYSGTSSELSVMTKDKVRGMLQLEQDFKLELLPAKDDLRKIAENEDNSGRSQQDILDGLIDVNFKNNNQKALRLKMLWKALKETV